RDFEAERLGGLQVDHQLEVDRLFHRKFGGLRTFKDLVDVAGGPEIQVRILHRVGHQSPGLYELARWIDGGQPMAGGQVNDRSPIHLGQAVYPDDKRVVMLLHGHFKCASEVLLASRIKKVSPETEGARRSLGLFPLGWSN